MQASPSDSTLKWVRIAGLVAVLGAMVGMIGDYCLLYSPGGGYMDGDYAFMHAIPNTRLLWGHYLGILAIPFESAGLYMVWLGLQPMGRRVATGSVLAGMYTMFAGVAYHGGVYPMADAVRRGGGQMEAYRPFNEPLGLAFAVVFFLLIAVLTVAILRGKTAFAPWMAAVSPLMGYMLVLLLYFTVPLVGNFLAPMGFNLAMAIFFGVLAWKAPLWLPKAMVD